MTKKLELTEEEWKKRLSEEEFRILRKKGTEAPFSGIYNAHFEQGNYVCKGCGNYLFSHEAKFESACGWPAFDRTAAKGVITEKLDTSHGMTRVEVLCSQCNGHLGHVFTDGPTTTGLRYCINSLAIQFEGQ